MNSSTAGTFGQARQALDDLLTARGLERAPLLVAFSGGPDSTLLLAVAAARGPRRRVRAVHVDHGWHADSGAWARHCRTVAREQGVQCEVAAVDARPRAGEGAEAAARSARYDALGRMMRNGEVLLTAHHADDQAETVLFALLRGGGTRGLAGMPPLRRFARGWHGRPLLDLPRAEVAAAVVACGLPCLDDPANRDSTHDRVFLREQVLPLLRRRWPRIDAGLVRSGRLAADSLALEDTVAARDFVDCRAAADPATGASTLLADNLVALPGARQRALLRWWLRREGLAPPPEGRLHSALAQIAQARPGRNPRIAWPGGEVRRWNGRVWALASGARGMVEHAVIWADPHAPLELPGRALAPELLGALGVSGHAAGVIRLIRRRGGERVRTPHARAMQSLTRVLRAAGVPPWERDAALLVEVDGALRGVIAGGLAIRLEGG